MHMHMHIPHAHAHAHAHALAPGERADGLQGPRRSHAAWSMGCGWLVRGGAKEADTGGRGVSPRWCAAHHVQGRAADHAAIASPVEVADAHRNAPVGGGGAGWSPWHVQAVAQGDGVVNGYTVRCGYSTLPYALPLRCMLESYLLCAWCNCHGATELSKLLCARSA